MIWYKGTVTLVSFDVGSGGWTVAFDDDEETTVAKFSDEDVRLID
jgi:hypothetical protein